MTKVDLNRLKGNYAQAIVTEWLSSACLVRPVAEGTDIGIDLYCESIIDGTPYLHFWVQVKAISPQSVKLIDNIQYASYRFKTQHLHYWKKQPIPVYALLVPIYNWPPVRPEKVFGIKLTDQIITKGIPPRKTVEYITNECFEYNNLEEDLRKFITEVVPIDATRLHLRNGIVSPLPGDFADDEKRFPDWSGFRNIEQVILRVLDTIRDGAVFSLMYSIFAERNNPSFRPIRKKIEVIAQLFEENMPPFGTAILVRSAHEDMEIEKAKSYIYSAIDRVDKDIKLSDEKKHEKIEKLQTLLRDFE